MLLRSDPKSYIIEVTDGPDVTRNLVIHAARPTRVYIGRSDTCELQLRDPLISGRHLALQVNPSGLIVHDVTSTHMLYVNGMLTIEAVLQGGEQLRLGRTTLRVENETAEKAPIEAATRFGRVLGRSFQMRRLYRLCRKLAASDVPVILEGETGTGKELLAESIHAKSKRSANRFVVFDCATQSGELAESTLFGHEPGALRGARHARPGLLEEADAGTLLLDEITELDSALQAKLHRAIERSEIQRLGGTDRIPLDVRILCATRRDVEAELQAGRLRDDLYYRLAVGRIQLPPLRDRQGDIEFLARHFWAELAGEDAQVPPDVLRWLATYEWPGNVRELRNAIAHRLAMGELADIRSIWRPPSRSPPAVREPEPLERPAPVDIVAQVLGQDLAFHEAREKVLRHFERQFVRAALERHGGNMTKAAAAAGVARRYMYAIRSRVT